MVASPAGLRTNRDVYLFVSELARARAEDPRTLEDYLRALRAIVRTGSCADSLTLDNFASILAQAFHHPLPPHDDADGEPPPVLAGWDECITAQIADLRGMEAAGTLHDEMRYFGIDAPSGVRWCNFVPSAYLEAGVAGRFGHWDPDDGSDGSPVVDLPTIDWETFVGFLECGAIYE